jgi:predicted cation transporter
MSGLKRGDSRGQRDWEVMLSSGMIEVIRATRVAAEASGVLYFLNDAKGEPVILVKAFAPGIWATVAQLSEPA